MNIVIIGYGFVGKALKSVLKEPRAVNSGIEVSIVDPAYAGASSFDDAMATNPDIVFICVPTPTVNSNCDDKIVVDYINRLRQYPGLVVIKSTIPVSTVEKVIKIRPTTVLWPELLRERFAEADIKQPKLIVIGAPSNVQSSYIINFISKYTNIALSSDGAYRVVSPKEASIFKYAVNSFLAMKVVFMHEMFSWMKLRGDEESYTKLIELLKLEGRIGSTHLDAPGHDGLGFAGSCFPKDVQALVGQMIDDGFEFPLLDNVIQANEKLRDESTDQVK